MFSRFSPVKDPFISYQLALAVVKENEVSEEKSDHFTDNLLTPEGLGVPEGTFSTLQVSAVHTHI
jgi:hypothetical protein